MMDIKTAAKEWAKRLDTLFSFVETPVGSILVMGVKDNKLVYREFKHYTDKS